VKARDLRDDRKTQAAAVTIAVLDPIETLEDERPLLRWNARAVILHRQFRLGACLDCQGHVPAPVAVAQGIIDEIGEHLAQQPLISAD
jgi:hypothetical protein